ncbi:MULTISPECIES: CDP-alcohol phosphatidyltransferase family protein [unclassified Campylobacter]|uniref:CDP-alcohol phosphatidyltransferase family protein n=1 Tax=unclassified Campylobacter TaxID=2593542 RepID=UPI0012381222|nr:MULTISPECIES: CDP-alcohol phosphatidyltransferase family protein [unclassified Campylobacter]KAA6225437.1 CDP-alcohol phosphatidyltransferase family protein [Campylobacter sp. LR196d]KAA6228789.1 CDP-alcohol phosphatidyltransferase family protein [Campylobacter sp. LR185c]KAA6229925.1 CDP-alcohol phosphatidyltransferase family protein [Campylobacter sp. LR286c]KAA6234233.1 CDP-alcohol phosphatidyltransferase family protein [Campylobacter sp. LR291e]KAA8604158.1 CDP-alcohol phosphatidyltrans
MNLDEKLKKDQRLESKKSYYLSEYLLRVLIIQKFILLPLAKTKITPNQITILAGIFVLISFVFISLKMAFVAGIFFLLYDFLDHIDGMLARYKNMSSKFGKFLDEFVDNIAFNGVFILIFFCFETNLYALIFILFIMNLHGIIASFVIVPRLKKLKTIKRFGLKKFLLDRGFILGIDASLLSFLIALSLFTKYFDAFFILIGLIYAFDIVYRLIELKRNEIKNESR